MMNTADYDYLMQTADNEAADTERHFQKCFYCAENEQFNCVHNRSDDEQTQNHADK